MKSLKKSFNILLVLLLAMPFLGKAHEEPSKTLKEKKDKLHKKQQVFQSKIKTATVWKSVFENKVESSVRHKAFVMGYDQKGNFTSIEAYKNDSLSERVEYTYSSTDDMLSDIDFSREGKMMEKNTYSYDKYGRVISGVSDNENNSISGYFKIINSLDKKSLDFVSYKTNDSIEYKITYKYPGDFDKYDYTEACKYDSSGALLMKVEKTYNAKGQPIRKTIFDTNGTATFYFVYDYDSKGNNIKITKKNSNDETQWEDHYSYDKNGNTTELKSYDKDKTLTAHLVYEFEYYK
jgi:hypothetical protein